MGRKRMFIVGLIGFAAASALGGVAQNAAMLFGARALQGGVRRPHGPGRAVPDHRHLHRADGAGQGLRRVRRRSPAAARRSASSPVASSPQYASWRWCLLVNVPVAVLTALFATRLVRESRASGNTRYDIPGA